jgi:hypothetical protein
VSDKAQSTTGEAAEARRTLAQRLAARYAQLPEVAAVALAGSHAAITADAGSDIDLYVFGDTPPALPARRALAKEGGEDIELDNQFWGAGDEWRDAASGIGVDVMYFGAGWIEEQLERVLRRYEASTGYSTAFWYTVRVAEPLFDRDGWLARLQTFARQPYPEPLRRAIIAKNYPILRDARSSYRAQLAKALARGDIVSLNHRTAALLASVFDILFALNRLPHPGEKRLLAHVEQHCPLRPPQFAEQVAALLAAAAEGSDALLPAVDALVDALDLPLKQEGLLVTKPHRLLLNS